MNFEEIRRENDKYIKAGLFQILTNEEVELYKTDARKNYKVGDTIDPLWHPVYLDECIKINDDAKRDTISIKDFLQTKIIEFDVDNERIEIRAVDEQRNIYCFLAIPKLCIDQSISPYGANAEITYSVHIYTIK